METTEICLGCTKMDNFYRVKAYFTLGKNGKSDFASSEKYSSYATGICLITVPKCQFKAMMTPPKK